MKKIPLTQGQFALVDDEDFKELMKYKWQVTTTGYARTSFTEKKCKWSIYMHRAISNAQRGEETDHVNRNRLDDRRVNLRIASSQQNKFNQGKHRTNTSGFRGVTWHKCSSKWLAQIYFNNKRIYLGVFGNKKCAHAAYCVAARELHGEFANP